jgi:predicted nucleic acid-binding protein
MGMIFDTSVWIGISGEQISEEAASEAAGEQRVFISVISLGELSFGVESAGDLAIRMHRRRALSTFEEMPVLDVTAQTANAFGMLAAFLKQTGRSPRTRVNDLWIAAQAIENDFALLTANIKDFEGLPGLRVVGL